MVQSLANLIRAQVPGRAESAAIIYGDRRITYGELDKASSRAANALAAEGVGNQDHVAFIDKNSPEYFETLFGAAKLNAIHVAVNWRLAPAQVEFTINDAQARVLFVGPDFYSTVEAIESNLSTVSKIVALGEHPRWQSYGSWLSGRSATDPNSPWDPEDTALQLYTSGTTGLPKGAMLTHANLSALLAEAGRIFQLDVDSVNLVAMPLFHIGGSGWALAGIAEGCVMVLVRDFNPVETVALMQEHRITNGFVVPAVLQFMCMVPGAEQGDYSSLRRITYGAAPITDTALKRAMAVFRCGFQQVYGLTETTGAITTLEPEDHDPDGPRAHLMRSAGRPLASFVHLRVVDPATGLEVPRGTVGEIQFTGPQKMKGYWARPEATDAAFTADGWFRTGDAGYIDQDGYLFLTDRIKDMIISGGENIYPIEVENVLAAHPAIADVAVIGVPHEAWGETVKAVVVLKPGVEATAEEIIEWSRTRLAGYQRPTSVDFVSELPRNPSGKILKRVLRDPYWVGRDRQIN